MKFSTTEVAQLHEAVRDWCHPQHPFLDPNYSTAMPAIDFTAVVADWLQAGRIEPVAELWAWIAGDDESSRYALRKALRADLPDWICLSTAARHEIKAIHILTMRAALSGAPEAMSSVAAELAASALACRELQIDPAYSDTLAKATRAELNPNSVLGSRYDKAEGTRLAIEAATSPLGEAEPAAAKLKVVPPMARLVVSDFLSRGWGSGLRFTLYYDHRRYGCGEGWNQRFIEWLDFFAPPDDDADVPNAVTKEILRAALIESGTTSPKSATRKRMIEQARVIPGLITALILRAAPEQRALRDEWAPSVKVWAMRRKSVEPVGAALFKLLMASSL